MSPPHHCSTPLSGPPPRSVRLAPPPFLPSYVRGAQKLSAVRKCATCGRPDRRRNQITFTDAAVSQGGLSCKRSNLKVREGFGGCAFCQFCQTPVPCVKDRLITTSSCQLELSRVTVGNTQWLMYSAGMCQQHMDMKIKPISEPKKVLPSLSQNCGKLEVVKRLAIRHGTGGW